MSPFLAVRGRKPVRSTPGLLGQRPFPLFSRPSSFAPAPGSERPGLCAVPGGAVASALYNCVDNFLSLLVMKLLIL